MPEFDFSWYALIGTVVAAIAGYFGGQGHGRRIERKRNGPR